MGASVLACAVCTQPCSRVAQAREREHALRRGKAVRQRQGTAENCATERRQKQMEAAARRSVQGNPMHTRTQYRVAFLPSNKPKSLLRLDRSEEKAQRFYKMTGKPNPKMGHRLGGERPSQAASDDSA